MWGFFMARGIGFDAHVVVFWFREYRYIAYLSILIGGTNG